MTDPAPLNERAASSEAAPTGPVLGRRSLRQTLSSRPALVAAIVRVASMAAVLFVVFAIATLTLDLAIDWFDGLAGKPGLFPSNWMTVADFWFAIGLFLMVLMGRRLGATPVARAQLIAWGTLFVASFAMFVLLAPDLSADDLPDGRYMVGFVVGWMAGPLAAIYTYDVTRGGRWWRAPLLGGLVGFGVQTALFFPISYSGTATPWGVWWAADYVIKSMASLGFVGVYWLCRRRIVPLPFLGGS